MIRVDLDADLPKPESMPLVELGAAWTRMVRTTPQKGGVGLLRLELAVHLQSKVLGGVTRAMDGQLAQFAERRAASTVHPETRP